MKLRAIAKMNMPEKPFGIAIETVWGQGYRITNAMKSIVKEFSA